MKASVFTALALAVGLLVTGCAAPAQSMAASEAKEGYTVGILQYTSHSSLDEICTAIQQELEQYALATNTPVKIVVKNGQGDAAALRDSTTLFLDQQVDVIVPIATPAALIAAATVQGSGIPLVYSAVADPVGSQLAQSMEQPGNNMTGVSDQIDLNRILALIAAQAPQLKTLGVVYNLSEPNSVAMVEQLKQLADPKGINLVFSTVTNPGEVQMATQDLLAQKAEALFVPIDNTVASAMSTLAQQAIQAGVPVYTAADSMVRDGGLATTGVNYTQLGELTAQMVEQVLEGADAGSLPVQLAEGGVTTVNVTTAQALGIDPQVFDLDANGFVTVE